MSRNILDDNSLYKQKKSKRTTPLMPRWIIILLYTVSVVILSNLSVFVFSPVVGSSIVAAWHFVAIGALLLLGQYIAATLDWKRLLSNWLFYAIAGYHSLYILGNGASGEFTIGIVLPLFLFFAVIGAVEANLFIYKTKR